MVNKKSGRSLIAGLIILAMVFIYLSISEGQKIEETPANLAINQVEENISLVLTEEKIDLFNIDEDEEDFFMEYRLERDRRRAQKIELLQSVLNSPHVADDLRLEAQENLLEITNSFDQELTLETLILAKGYADVAAFVQPESITIVVRDGDFDEEEMMKIADLVTRTTGTPLSKITIFAKK